MAFSKFDPYREEAPTPPWAEPAGRRALLLKYGWWVSVAYVAVGFAFIVYWLATGQA